MDRYWKKLQTILLAIAKEDPNRFLREVYYSGMEEEEIKELQWLVKIARRAPGYEESLDLLRKFKIV